MFGLEAIGNFHSCSWLGCVATSYCESSWRVNSTLRCSLSSSWFIEIGNCNILARLTSPSNHPYRLGPCQLGRLRIFNSPTWIQTVGYCWGIPGTQSTKRWGQLSPQGSVFFQHALVVTTHTSGCHSTPRLTVPRLKRTSGEEVTNDEETERNSRRTSSPVRGRLGRHNRWLRERLVFGISGHE